MVYYSILSLACALPMLRLRYAYATPTLQHRENWPPSRRLLQQRFDIGLYITGGYIINGVQLTEMLVLTEQISIRQHGHQAFCLQFVP